MPTTSPVTAWKYLREGNERFINGIEANRVPAAKLRTALVEGQHPTAVIFGCGDSRVAAEIIFDVGLGDTFVVRTAGHVLDDAVIGSIEYAVEVLDVPLVVVLGHDSCGAVAATLNALDNHDVPNGFIRSIIEKVMPSILMGRREGLTTLDELEARHVIETGRLLQQRSTIINDRIKSGELAIVGATYKLSDGRIHLRSTVGDVGEIVHHH